VLPSPLVPAPSTPAHAPAPLLVASEGPLGELLARLDADGRAPVALDTEADSFHHYFEKVCLVQVGFGGRAFLVDPLAGLDLAPLLARLAARPLLMHGADYDLRLLYRSHGFRATSLFDTMIAAQLVGEKEIGLAALLSARVGVALDKAHQRADWSERPLSPSMSAYAAADVVHLPALVESLARELEAKGRLAWHAEECARLAATVFRTERLLDPENDWRIKGSNALRDQERAFLRAFWEAREARARALDRPPFRVLSNERLLAAAPLASRGERDLAKLFPSPRPLPDAFACALRAALEAAAALPPAHWPGARRGARAETDPVLEREVERLKKTRDARAQALGLDPGVLASKASLTAAARVKRAHGAVTPGLLVDEAGFSRWRAELLAI
jgi:ribonuclease D